jgi:hypothetical protein
MLFVYTHLFYFEQTSIGCNAIVNSDQCTEGVVWDKECIWVSEESKGLRCQEVKSSCEEIIIGSVVCEKAGAAKFEDMVYDCFWLYDGSWGDSGSCKSKNNGSLGCSDAKRSDQCTNTNINNFGNNCLWIKNETNETRDICKTKVVFFFFMFIFFIYLFSIFN